MLAVRPFIPQFQTSSCSVANVKSALLGRPCCHCHPARPNAIAIGLFAVFPAASLLTVLCTIKQMTEHSRPYAIDSEEECERLERQARLANIEAHLRFLPVSPRDPVLDAGCGSGSMSRLLAHTYPQAEVIGVDLREQYLDFAPLRIKSRNACKSLHLFPCGRESGLMLRLGRSSPTAVRPSPAPRECGRFRRAQV